MTGGGGGGVTRGGGGGGGVILSRLGTALHIMKNYCLKSFSETHF